MFDEKNGYKKQMEAHLIHEYNLSLERATKTDFEPGAVEKLLTLTKNL